MLRVARWILTVLPSPLRQVWFRIRASPLGHRLAHGTFWMVTGTMISKLLGLGSSIILARILGKIPFGEFGTIQSTVGLFGVFAGMGIGITATKYVAEYRELQVDRCGRIIGFSLAASLVGGVLASAFFWRMACHPYSCRATSCAHVAGGGRPGHFWFTSRRLSGGVVWF